MGDYSQARIVQGFKELLERLRSVDQPDHPAIIRANTRAREEAQDRVRREYMAIGCEPPCAYALSITARRELGYGLPQVAKEEEAA